MNERMKQGMANEIKCEKKIVQEIFNMWYLISDYQRAYVWDTDQVRDLLDDTMAVFSRLYGTEN